MEILYLWVEDFKSLKNHGYHFSSKQRFSAYKTKQALELSSLPQANKFPSLVYENRNYKFNAIVGANGSGKSSILELLAYFAKRLFLSSFNDECYDFKQVKLNTILVFKLQNGDFLVVNNTGESINFNQNPIAPIWEDQETLKLLRNKLFFYHFNFTTESPGVDSEFKPFFNKHVSNQNLLLAPNKDQTRNEIELLVLKKVNQDDEFIATQNFFKPNGLRISIDPQSEPLETPAPQGNGYFIASRADMHLRLLTHFQYLAANENLPNFLSVLLGSKILQLILKLQLKDQNNRATLGHILNYAKLDGQKWNESGIDQSTLETLTKLAIKTVKDPDFINLLLSEKLSLGNATQQVEARSFEMLSEEKKIRQIIKIQQSIQSTIKESSWSIDDTFVYTEVEHLKGKRLHLELNYLPSWLRLEPIEMATPPKRISSLSGGERLLLSQLVTFHEAVISSKAPKNSMHILMLDETDLGFHPEWQRRYIYYLLELFKQSKVDIQIILTSHSPFIVSDFPSHNILFLINGEPQELEHINKTFAQNIHTLLHESFFLTNTLGALSQKTLDPIFQKFEEYQDLRILVNSISYELNIITSELEKGVESDFTHGLRVKKDELLDSYEQSIKQINKIGDWLNEKVDGENLNRLEYYRGLIPIIGETYLQKSLENCIKILVNNFPELMI